MKFYGTIIFLIMKPLTNIAIFRKSKIQGAIHAKPSKSVMQRLVAASLLSTGDSKIFNYGKCNDSTTSLQIAEQLGAKILVSEKSICISGGLQHSATVNCEESGLSLRMFSPIIALLNKEVEVKGTGSLLKRPTKIIEEALQKLGVHCISSKSFLPLKITGPININSITIDASVSSQLLTGLLFALPLTSTNTTIFVNNLNSKPYIALTLEILAKYEIAIENIDYKEFRIKGNQKFIAHETTVEGDWSSASNLLVAAAIAGEIEIFGLNSNSLQADRKILNVLENVGAEILITKNSVKVKKAELNSFNFDATDCPDLFPILVSLAINCNDISTITGVERLRFKESDRASVIKTEFEKLGARIDILGDIMKIYPSKISGAKVDSNNDHRIAMALSIAALKSETDVEISNFSAINKSYPEFLNDIRSVIKENYIK